MNRATVVVSILVVCLITACSGLRQPTQVEIFEQHDTINQLDKEITKAKDRYNMTVVAHREGPQLNIRTITRPNIGLDWGAYDFYLKNCWQGATNVLFIQDDTRLDDIDELERISALSCDQAFIFSDEAEAAFNSYGLRPFLFHYL